MTELVRTVRSGSVGLDLVLGGGPRLLQRMSGSKAESATMLVRGGPGAGKSVLATDIALRMARALGGDVLYVCVEILPSEVLAQRMGFDDGAQTKTIDLAQPDARKASGDGPTLVVGMTEMEDAPADEGGGPDLGRMILDLLRIAAARGCDPRVVVVDSLSDGYELGAEVPRATVDGVCKLAVQQGWVLVLVEETVEERESPWPFAVDTVLSLEVTPAGRRELRVSKHRFGPCQSGPHRLLVERDGVRVVPCFAAYRHAVRDLALPPPAAKRSHRVPAAEAVLDSQRFDVPDGEGRVVVAQAVSPGDLAFAETIGAAAQDGLPQPNGRATLYLHESYDSPFARDGTGFKVGTLHSMIDGEEWLEGALSLLAAEPPLAQVRVGPTDGLGLHPQQYETLRSAISLLASILVRRGLVVVLFGNGAAGVLRNVIANETWIVGAAANRPAGRLNVQQWVGNDRLEFEAVVP